MTKLILALLLFPLVGMGQKTLTSKDTLTLPVDLSGPLTISAVGWTGTSPTFTGPITGDKPKPDTTYTRCLLFVCDTASNEGTLYGFGTPVYWQFGYEVKRYVGDITTSGQNGMGLRYLPQYEFVCYLNQDKSPMRKSVVVWMVKEIE